MRSYRKLLVVGIMFGMVAILLSCATVPKTPEGHYYAVLKQFDGVLLDYVTHYEQAPTATQEKWKREITPVFRAASKALDAWHVALTIGSDPIEQELMFINLRKQLFVLMLEHGILEVGK